MKKLIILVVFFMTTLFLSSCNIKSVYTKDLFVLSTIVNINITTTNGNMHLKNIEKIYRDVDNYCSYYNSYEEDNVYSLNTKREIEASDLLLSIIETANELITKTNGYYNPLIGSLADKWKNAIKNEKVLESIIIEEELNKMNNTKIVIDSNKIKLEGEANLDLGGIAKGYATELVHKYLIDNKIDEYLINSGESNILLGKRNRDYVVALNNPFDEKYYGYYKGQNVGIATSSPEHQSFKDNEGVLYHHIISPFTGYPLNIYESVNVITNNSTYADAYSTAIFSMDIDTAKEFADNNNLGIILCDSSNIIYSKVDGIVEEI